MTKKAKTENTDVVEAKGVAVKQPTFSLPNKKVNVIPVIQKGGWLPEGHAAEHLFMHSTYRFSLPRHEFGGSYVNPFTPEEVEFLESDPRLALKPGALSVHKTDSFWKTSFKPVILGKNKLTLDLSDPMDYITYKVLLLQKDYVAPSAEDMYEKASYKFAIVDLDYADAAKSDKANSLANAFSEYLKIREDKQELADVLFMITNQRVSIDQSKEWLQGQVGEFVQKNPQKFLEIVLDEARKTKLLITKAITYGAMQRDKMTYRTSGGDLIGTDLNSAIQFLNSDSNQDIRLMIENMVNTADNKH